MQERREETANFIVFSRSAGERGMASASKSEAAPSVAEEERVAQALIARGLVTAEEVENCGGEPSGAQGLLQRLVKSGGLTARQAKRVGKELEQLVDQQIPGYQLMDKLGQGRMGTVYKARQISMNRLVAVKVLHSRLASNREFLDRFRREAHLAARCSSNNVVQAIDVGSAGNTHYFVMEFVEGRTVRQEIDNGKVYKEREALEIILQVTQALDHAHRRGLVHRDVKPGNIILTTEGVVKLADLGLARDTSDRATVRAEKGVLVGTPYYIAPEQIEGRDDIDIRVDLYALGATLYHMVTGQPPFPGKDVDAILDAHLEAELTPPDHINRALSAGLGEVAEFLLAKDPDDRYRSPAELIIDLDCLLKGEAPRLARQRMRASMLDDLADGEEDEEQEERTTRRRRRRKKSSKSTDALQLMLMAFGAALLFLSLVINAALMLTRK
jgi:eukaryotic-like serine/threonine-protein kinase